MDSLIGTLRWIHIGAGLLALGVAPGAMLTVKGGRAHRRWGKIYFWLMAVVADRAAADAGIDLNEARGAIPAEQWPSLLAEYIINGISALPSYYTTAPYWQVVGDSLLRLRTVEPFRRDALVVEQAGKTLLLPSGRTIQTSSVCLPSP